MDQFSFVGNGDVAAFDKLYSQYKDNPESVDSSWQNFFKGFEFQHANYSSETLELTENMHQEFKVLNLIDGYRFRGHLFTKTNPVRDRRKYSPTLAIENYGLNQNDLETVFQAGEEIGLGAAKLKDIIAHLEATYCVSIGIEYNYIRTPNRLNWIRERIELKNRPQFNVEQKKLILDKLSKATYFEQFLQTKFVGQKRFSVEGAEALIPALDHLIDRGAEMGVQEFVMGMAHRGRLNVLANIFNKDYKLILSEFEGKEYEKEGFDGDVKYHLGWSENIKSHSGKDVHLTLAPNPSHLEAVDPVVQGIARAKIDNYLNDENKIVPILIHGDAAIAGQGVVYEVVQMAQLDGYRAGGTIHIVINNQVGFTTNYLDARSSTYCTDVAKVTLCPVFHVNGDDIEALIQTVQIAIEYRQKFNRDVFIDLLCYRKYGHNEGDEPKFTQPKLYDIIAKHPNPRDIYAQQLIDEGVITKEYSLKQKEDFIKHLNNEFDAAKKIEKFSIREFLRTTWKDYELATTENINTPVETAVSKDKLIELGTKLATLPEGKNYFRKIKKLMNDRIKMIENNQLDWGMGEMLAYATLLDENHPVRISGQDVERGTFSHRHAVIKTEDTEEEIIPLNLLSDKQGKYTIYNSLLSEYAVLGFDYGYAFSNPHGLTIWEAQFGDFNNGAQIIIDQFISAAEDKWGTMNGITMLLPHGYEGMGSEHSSGRMERYLTLCAENNLQIANPTTPANFFHLLRRQIKRNFRKPLIVFSPKKLLRYPKAVSTLEDLATGTFQEVISEQSANDRKIDTIAFCTGKIYYDLLEVKQSKNVGDNVNIVRLEQLYPFPKKQILDIINQYPEASIKWVQEEPENMGAWSFILQQFYKMNVKNIEVISRPASGSPAAGSPKVHQKRQSSIINKLFQMEMQNA